MAKNKLKGTGVAIVTPFKNDGSIDFKSYEKLIEHLISNGVNYLVVLGTTGEAATLNKDEKQALVSYTIEVVKKRVPIVVGVGGNNTQEVVNTIKSCNFKGIDAILSATPYYNKPNQRGLYLHYKTIANASPIPVILYNVPGRTGVNMTAETTLKLAHEFENIIAVKEASANISQIMYILKYKPENFMVISGDDALTLPLIALGASGVISVVANACPKAFCEMVDFSLKGNFKAAQTAHYKLLEITDALFEEGSPAGAKAALNSLGIIENNLRLPLTGVTKPMYSKIAKLLEII